MKTEYAETSQHAVCDEAMSIPHMMSYVYRWAYPTFVDKSEGNTSI